MLRPGCGVHGAYTFCVLLSGSWAVKVQSIANGAGKDFRDGAVVPFE